MALSDDPNQKNDPSYSYTTPKGAGTGGGWRSTGGQQGSSEHFNARTGRRGWSGEPPSPYDAPEFYDGLIGKRVIAYFIDSAILLVAVGILWVIAFIVGVLTLGLGFGVIAACAPFLPLLYYAFSIAHNNGATPGMSMMGVYACSYDGSAIPLPLAFWRAFAFLLSTAFPIVLIFAMFNPRRQALHDIVSHSIVVRDIR